MTTGKGMTFKTMSEADLEPVLALLQGGDPDAVAQRTGIGKHRLLSIHKDMLALVIPDYTKIIGLFVWLEHSLLKKK